MRLARIIQMIDFFSRAEISEILSNMKAWNNIFRTKYKCEFSGSRIENRFSVFHKLYFERKENNKRIEHYTLILKEASLKK